MECPLHHFWWANIVPFGDYILPPPIRVFDSKNGSTINSRGPMTSYLCPKSFDGMWSIHIGHFGRGMWNCAMHPKNDGKELACKERDKFLDK
jgi:hypothetical protein